MSNYAIRLKSDELSHHGILGQKWGKKNGPPYPLEPGNHSAAERKAGWKDSLKKSRDTVKERASNMSDDELVRDNKRKALEAQYVKNHKDEDPDTAIDRAWKVGENTKTAINGASRVVDVVDKATKKTVRTNDIDISTLSDKELQQIVNRMNLEAQYNRMTTKEVSDKGVVYVREILELAGGITAITSGAVTLMRAMKH